MLKNRVQWRQTCSRDSEVKNEFLLNLENIYNATNLFNRKLVFILPPILLNYMGV